MTQYVAASGPRFGETQGSRLPRRGGYRRCGKRALDIALGVPLLLAILPFMLLIGFLALVVQGRPVLFRQVRPGLRGRSFELVKLRTMATPSSKITPDSDADRISTLGRGLRATSLDELPQLVNVIRGDMSLVGPRPLLMQYLERYTPQQARRHEVKPGITGWAQVNGRNALTWEQKFEMDVWYVDHVSFGLDMKILAMTLITAFAREGVCAPGSATMPEFTGSDSNGKQAPTP